MSNHDELIDQLIEKMEDSEIDTRLKASQRLTSLAKLVGPVKTRTALLPKLHEKFGAGEPDDQVAKIVSEQLGSFVPHVGGPSHVNNDLLGTLCICAAIEETVVRDAAAASIAQIAEQMTDTAEMVGSVVHPLANGSWFTAKVSACKLFAAVYPSAGEQKGVLLELFAALVGDATPMVRREAARNVGKFAQAVEQDNHGDFVSNLLPHVAQLCKDKSDSVKIALMEDSLFTIAGACQSSEIADHVMPLVAEFADDESWNMRSAVAKRLSKMFDCNDIPNGALFEIMVELLQDSEAEVRSQAIAHVGKASKLVAAKDMIEQVVPHLNHEANSLQCRTRLVTVCAEMMANDKLQKATLPVIVELLQDEEFEVKFKMMQQLPVLSGIDLKDPGLKMEAFMEQWAGNLDTPWQIRQVMATLIPRLARDFGATVFESRMMGVFESLFHDRVAAVREAWSGSIGGLRDDLGSDWILQNVMPRLEDWMTSTVKKNGAPARHLQRTAVIEAVKSLMSKKDPQLEQPCVQLLVKGLSDKVVNVQIMSAMAAAAAKPFIEEGNFEYLLEPLDKLKLSEADDARTAASEALA